MVNFIIFFIGLLLGLGLGGFGLYALHLEKSPIIGDLCLIKDDDTDVLYMGVNDEYFLNNAASCKYVRLKIDDSVKSYNKHGL